MAKESYLGDVDQIDTANSEFVLKDAKGNTYTFDTGGATLPAVSDTIVAYVDGGNCLFWAFEGDVKWAMADGNNPGNPPPTSPF